MKQKLLLLLLLVLGLVSVACQQNGDVVTVQVSVDEILAVAEVPQVAVETVEVAPAQSKSMLKIASDKVELQKGVAETAVSVPELEKAVVPTADDDKVIHTVEEGEWIFEIARCYGTTAQAIINANFYYYHYGYYYKSYANYIYPGQKLTIPNVDSTGDKYGPPCVRKHEETYQHTDGRVGTYIHKVEQGDWIYELARCYGSTPELIIKANALYNPDHIKLDQLLVIPLGGTTDTVDGPECIDLYTVVEGDTWASIATAHDTTEVILKKANPDALKVGDRIWVPIH